MTLTTPKKWTAAGISLALALPSIGHAQNDITAQDTLKIASKKKAGEVFSLQDSGGPLDGIGVSAKSDGEGFRPPEFEIQSDGSTATAVIETSFDRVETRGRNLRRWSLNLGASVPFEENSEEDNFFDFRGIGGGASLNAGVNFSFARLNSSSTEAESANTFRSLVDEAMNICVLTNINDWVDARLEKDLSPEINIQAAAQYRSAYEEALRENLRTFIDTSEGPTSAKGPIFVENAISRKVPQKIKSAHTKDDDNSSTVERLSDKVKTACVPAKDGTFVSDTALLRSYLGDDWADAYLQSFGFEGALWTLGTEGRVTFEDSEFLDRTAFTIVSEDETEWEVSGFAAYSSKDGNKSFRLSGSYTRTLERADEVEVCRPNDDGTEDCLTGADGPPTFDIDGFVSAEGRLRFASSDRLRGQFGIAPKATYNIDEDNWQFELPVFLQTNDDGMLDGGIRFAYETEDNDFGVAVFVGRPF